MVLIRILADADETSAKSKVAKIINELLKGVRRNIAITASRSMQDWQKVVQPPRLVKEFRPVFRPIGVNRDWKRLALSA